jgi:MFS family permease
MGLLQTIIRNEAMKQDPPEIYGWRAFAIAATACLGGILFGMDTGTMGGVLVLPAFKKEFRLDGLGKVESANLSANIVSALQAGCFLGAILAWPLADSIGRRTALITAAVIATAGTAMQAASSGYLQAVYAGRYISPRVVYKDTTADFRGTGWSLASVWGWLQWQSHCTSPRMHHELSEALSLDCSSFPSLSG